VAQSLQALFDSMPQRGRVDWLGVRPAKYETLQPLEQVWAEQGVGLVGDRYASQGGKRQVTLIQQEHLGAIASILGRDAVEPGLLRRNIAVSGINLLALKQQQFAIGEALFYCTGLCHPCSRMEEIFGPGGYNAVRGHGGITAQVIQGGLICLGDAVRLRLDG
jgi:MOSC domain-containing protein YiiM